MCINLFIHGCNPVSVAKLISGQVDVLGKVNYKANFIMHLT